MDLEDRNGMQFFAPHLRVQGLAEVTAF